MSESRPFAYSVLRVVPCIERGERLNVGLVLFCRQFDFLEMEVSLNHDRLAAIAPDLDPEPVEARLAVIQHVIAGDPAAGALAQLDRSDRFGWLTAPSSTIIQSSEVHTGLTREPGAELQKLFASLVL
ncbi:MAG: DUF3037 domain-containing protein [Solirubrobacterales bacterium]|nr:DUF3037 domain-containing protein [Solirubrobacterales bacterium]HMT04585.1 DUF3037 domain-containing protein [Solirubrobacterales bacterium]